MVLQGESRPRFYETRAFTTTLAKRWFEPGGSWFSPTVLREIDPTAYSALTDSEKAAFELGYKAGMVDNMVIAGSVVVIAAFWFILFSPVLYAPIRRLVQPWAKKHVIKGRKWVTWAQTFRHPTLDKIHTMCSYTCGLEFYITFLPFLFWCGEVRIARLLTVLMAICIYIGNAVKDVVCSPRPDWSKQGVVMIGDLEGSKEYGLPSTHTLNTVGMTFYLLHYYSLYHVGGGGCWFLHNLETGSSCFLLCTAGLVLWNFHIMFGRMYVLYSNTTRTRPEQTRPN